MSTPCQHRRSPSRRPLQLELLEDRSVPTAYALTDLGNLGGPQSAQAYDINDVGQVVGYATSAAGPQRAFLWQDGGMTELGTLGGSASLANALNDAGQVVGTSRTTTGSSATNPFLWEGGVMTDLGVGPGTAYGINDAGQVVGQRNTHGFLWDDGAVTAIGAFGGGARKEGHSGTTVFAFTVTLSAASVVPVTVNFATSDGAAKAGEDYDAKSGTATFAPGESSKTITVVVRGDRAVEGSEWFGVNLTGAAGAFILDGQGLGLILDDDRR